MFVFHYIIYTATEHYLEITFFFFSLFDRLSYTISAVKLKNKAIRSKILLISILLQKVCVKKKHCYVNLPLMELWKKVRTIFFLDGIDKRKYNKVLLFIVTKKRLNCSKKHSINNKLFEARSEAPLQNRNALGLHLIVSVIASFFSLLCKN